MNAPYHKSNQCKKYFGEKEKSLFLCVFVLQTLEHCIGDFLDKCDGNGDHKITLEVSHQLLDLIATFQV